MKILTMEKKECCGCGACEQICPKNAITMIKDNEGFSYPSIDENLCISCNLCEKVCGFDEDTLDGKDKAAQRYFWVKNSNEEERMRSRSGGFFYIIAKWIISQGGVVYGSIIDEDNLVKHIRATDIDSLALMQGSKYVESDITGIYTQVREDLTNNINVLFTGTGCQVAGLYGFLNGKTYDNLITTDIVCHGTCSSRVFKDYIDFWENKKNGKVENFNFRNKVKFGWEPAIESFSINNKDYYRRNYSRLFYSHNAMRPSCSNCYFANVTRIGDFTLADFWGMKKFYPELDDDKGVSSVFVNNDKAMDIWTALTDYMNCGAISEESVIQPNLLRATSAATTREAFWKLYGDKGFEAVFKVYGGYDMKSRFKWFIKMLVTR